MIENATNLTNATNITTQSEVTAIGPIIYWFKTFFLETWVGNFLLFILVLATVGAAIMPAIINIKNSYYRELAQECATLFQPRAVRLDYDKKRLKYTLNPPHTCWDLFKIAMEKQIKHCRYKARRLCKKVKKAFNDYIDCDDKLKKEVKNSLNDRFAREGLDFIWLDANENEPLEDFVRSEEILECISRGEISLDGDVGTNGRYILLCKGIKIAKTEEPKTREILKDLIELISKDSEIAGHIKKHSKAKSDLEQLLEEYNKKIERAIRDLKVLRWGWWWLK